MSVFPLLLQPFQNKNDPSSILRRVVSARCASPARLQRLLLSSSSLIRLLDGFAHPCSPSWLWVKARHSRKPIWNWPLAFVLVEYSPCRSYPVKAQGRTYELEQIWWVVAPFGQGRRGQLETVCCRVCLSRGNDGDLSLQRKAGQPIGRPKCRRSHCLPTASLLTNERDGLTMILLPRKASFTPRSFCPDVRGRLGTDRSALWNAAEAAERRKIPACP